MTEKNRLLSLIIKKCCLLDTSLSLNQFDEEYVDQVAQLQLDVLQTLKDLLFQSSPNLKSFSNRVLDVTLEDIALSNFKDIALFDSIQSFNQIVSEGMSEWEKNKTENKNVGFKEKYIQRMTDVFGNELDELRTSVPDFNEQHFNSLIDNLEKGASLFEDLMHQQE